MISTHQKMSLLTRKLVSPQVREWAYNIKDTKGFLVRAFICASLTLILVLLIMMLTLRWIHPWADPAEVFFHYMAFIPSFAFTIPVLWLMACSLGLGVWYASYFVGVLHAVAAGVIINVTRTWFISDAQQSIYFGALDQDASFMFVLLAEFCYLWVVAAIGSLAYVGMTSIWFPTMATWFRDNPLDETALVSKYRPARNE